MSVQKLSNLVISVLMLLITACGGRAPGAVPVPQSHDGRYQFFERIPNTTPAVVLEGEFLVRGDAVTVTSRQGDCRYEERESQALTLAYRCGDLLLSFDRFKLGEQVGYTIPATITTYVEGCAMYGQSRGGDRVCTRTRMESVKTDVLKQGVLRPRRVAP